MLLKGVIWSHNLNFKSKSFMKGILGKRMKSLMTWENESSHVFHPNTFSIPILPHLTIHSLSLSFTFPYLLISAKNEKHTHIHEIKEISTFILLIPSLPSHFSSSTFPFSLFSPHNPHKSETLATFLHHSFIHGFNHEIPPPFFLLHAWLSILPSFSKEKLHKKIINRPYVFVDSSFRFASLFHFVPFVLFDVRFIRLGDLILKCPTLT